MTEVLERLQELECNCSDDFVCVRCSAINEINRLNQDDVVEDTILQVINTPTKEELIFWESIKESKESDSYSAYLELFPNGLFASLAGKRLSKLEDIDHSSKPSKNTRRNLRRPPASAIPKFDYDALHEHAIANTKRRIAREEKKEEE